MRQAGIGAAALAVASSVPLKGALASTLKDGMVYRRLGRTGLDISEISIGCGGINPSKANILRAALSQGVNYIDTSSGYGRGQSEAAIGETVKARSGKGKVVRHNVICNRMIVRLENNMEVETELNRIQTVGE